MKGNPPACGAWDLLIQLLLSQRGQLPVLAAALELSPAQCHVLYIIEPGRPVPMKQLAVSLSCDASNVTGLVDRLESRGLIRRQPGAADRRVKELELTPTGARLRAELIARMSTPPPAVGRLSARDQRELERILSRLLQS
ncbi:MAG TPA: MarR family transcriptional regulator [Vicinamibacterales bacterium]|jgi:DNA-binding MarR family transcriptional regulator|nr:MarR family transcriptional regulator [Vicinamibacterales bacterium]